MIEARNDLRNYKQNIQGNADYKWLGIIAIEVSENKQFNKQKIETPFVIGAIIELGNCLNLVAPESLSVLTKAYQDISKIYEEADIPLPKNSGSNRKLDAAAFKHLHKSRE